VGDTTADVDWERLERLARSAAGRWSHTADAFEDARHEALVAGWQEWDRIATLTDASAVWLMRCRVIDVWRVRDGRRSQYVVGSDGRLRWAPSYKWAAERPVSLDDVDDEGLSPALFAAELAGGHHDSAGTGELLDHYGIVDPRERLIVVATVAGLTSQAIADLLGVTESRVSQLRRAMADRLAPLAGRTKPHGTVIRHHGTS
jgi:DNA-directed RNA polymerase specialized sigma24 family protein